MNVMMAIVGVVVTMMVMMMYVCVIGNSLYASCWQFLIILFCFIFYL